MNITKTGFEPNEKQKECINTIEGTVMVLAGPGTGKTYTIIQRIKYMIESGITPSSILCLTYSDAAANEMKSRLVKEAGTVAGSVSVNTYHSFCNEIIRQYPQEFELLDGVELIDEITKRLLMSEVLEEVNPVYYRTKWGDCAYYIPELIKAVDEIKSNQVDKIEYFNTLNTHANWQGKMDELQIEYNEREQKGKLVKTFLNTYETHKKKMGKAKEAWEIFEKYDIKLKQHNYIDFNDMINMVLSVFEINPDFLAKVSKKYKYFLVDEYQDTNYSQNRIVFALLEGAKSSNVFVVGDDDQIIYEFQGAKTDTLEKFLNKFPQTKVICLNENNRSTQNILDFSYDVISQDKTRLEFNTDFKKFNISKKLTASNSEIKAKNNKISVTGFADFNQENNFIIKKIEALIESSDFPLNKKGEKDISRIAILTRENRELDNFANLLESKNIQYQIKENKSIFDIKSSLLVYFYLKALENHYLHADKLFGILLSEPFAFNTSDYNYLLEQNRLNHKDFIFNIRENMQSYKWENPGKVKKFLSTYNKLCRLKNNINLKQLIINVINETGILDYFVQSDINKSENIYAIKKIIQEAASYIYIHKDALLNDFLNYIDYAFESGIPILTDKDDYTQNAVQLLTMHGSKGREFEYVFIPNLISKKWENKRVNNTMSLPIIKNNDKAEETAEIKSEQLRLLFVGITRAKHSLYLSFSNSIDGKPQELTSYLSEAVKNENIVATFNQELSKDDYLNELVFSLKKNHYDYKSAFKCELEARIANFILSPSTLNQYENCPQSFLYNSVLKIPILDKPTDNANYGRAIHAALQFCANYARANDVYPDKNLFIDSFIKNLSKEKFESEEDRLKYQTRGIESLSKYHIQFVQTPINRIYSTEYKLDFVPFNNHFIKGFVDRIERNQDGSFELYDYKTGGAKSKSQIADGKEYEGYLNQLRFYKYAFEIKNPEAVVSKAGLIFVEEPHANFYVNLTSEDNKIIENKILNAYENISALNFDPPSPLERKCEYCDYKHLCRLCEL